MNWYGVSVQTGGEIGLGADTYVGAMFQKNDSTGQLRFINFEAEKYSLGLGLGGSASLNLVMAFNIHTEDQLADCSDSGFDFSLDLVLSVFGKTLGSIPQALNSLHRLKGALGPGMNFVRKSANLMEYFDDTKQIAETVIGNGGGALDALKGKPLLIQIPVGVGLRVSLKYQRTTVYAFGSGVI